jgi:hypothetical protein
LISIAAYSSQIKENNTKTFNAINTTASPSAFFLVSIAAVCKHYQPKTRKTILL